MEIRFIFRRRNLYDWGAGLARLRGVAETWRFLCLEAEVCIFQRLGLYVLKERFLCSKDVLSMFRSRGLWI